MLKFRDRVRVTVDGVLRWGSVIETRGSDSLATFGSLLPARNEGPQSVRVWLDGEQQPMAEMVPTSSLVR